MTTRAADEFAAIRHKQFEIASLAAKLARCHQARGIPVTDPDLGSCWCKKPDGGWASCPPGWGELAAARKAVDPAPVVAFKPEAACKMTRCADADYCAQVNTPPASAGGFWIKPPQPATSRSKAGSRPQRP